MYMRCSVRACVSFNLGTLFLVTVTIRYHHLVPEMTYCIGSSMLEIIKIIIIIIMLFAVVILLFLLCSNNTGTFIIILNHKKCNINIAGLQIKILVYNYTEAPE